VKWNESFFSMWYYDLFMARSQQKIDHEVSVIKTLAKVKEGASVVDFCCGVGDLLHAFEKGGHEASGVEWSSEYVEHARAEYRKILVAQGNAINYNFGRTFDVALNWYSSFGYFDDASNVALLENMRRHVKSGGKAVVEVFNSYDVLKNFTARMEYERSHRGLMYRIQRDSSVDLSTRRLSQRWTVKNNLGHVHTYDTENTLYFQDEIVERMERVGFKNVACYDRPMEGKALITSSPSLDSKRIVFIGEVE
jgi:SAM-dependent methyltransferase